MRKLQSRIVKPTPKQKVQIIGCIIMLIIMMLIQRYWPLHGNLGFSPDQTVFFIRSTLPIDMGLDPIDKEELFLAVINRTIPADVKKPKGDRQNAQVAVENPTPPPPTPDPTPTPEVVEATLIEGANTIKASAILMDNQTNYQVDVDSLLNSEFRISNREGPKVLIVHTHTSESYTQSPDYTYVETDPYRTEDESKNICRVGSVIKRVLEEHGIETLHITKSHDYPSYTGSYNRSLETVSEALANHPSISIVLDVHRDSIENAGGAQIKVVADIEGKKSAQALVIVGTDSNGLDHKNWRTNLTLGLKLQAQMVKTHANLARPISLRKERFNTHLSKGALLLEIGSSGNTMEEAEYCAELLGKSLAETIEQQLTIDN